MKQQPQQRDQAGGMQNDPSGEQDRSHMGDKPGIGRGADQGKVGQDTDGDGKVVQPGQKPGQSHGQGLDDE